MRLVILYQLRKKVEAQKESIIKHYWSIIKVMLSYAYASSSQHLVCIGYKKE